MNGMNEEVKSDSRNTAGDYTVKKNRVLDTVAKVVTLLLAVSIWIYVSTTNVVEKPVSLAVKEKSGLDFSDRITLEYQSLTVRGSSSIVDSLQVLQLEDFSAKTLEDEDGDGMVQIDLSLKEDVALKEISEFLKPNGNSFSGNKVKVKATINVGDSYEITVPKEYVKISDTRYELAQDSVTLIVRSLSPEDDYTVVNQLKSYLDASNTETKSGVISIFANIDETTDLNAVPILISFEGNFKGQIYEVGTSYTVKVQKTTQEEVK